MAVIPDEKARGYVTAPLGFKASGISCGIKERGVKDLALLFCERNAQSAGTFTTNRFRAAPVILSRDRLSGGTARAVVINSGCANAATGDEGMRDAEQVTLEVSRRLGLKPAEVLAASTGRIGRRLPVEKIRAAVPELAASLSREGGRDAAVAILTTDTGPKESIARFEAGGREITIGGMAKGAGMIHPLMATMLAFITTDAAVSPSCLRLALARSVELSFNCISVDGDRSTNDSVFIMASGMAGNRTIESVDSEDGRLFVRALDEVTAQLAEMIVRDGEGASKFIEINVSGTKDREEARKLGFAIANSPLVKAAMYGEDPNWGRILSTLGAAGVDFDPGGIVVSLQGRCVFRDGAPCAGEEAGPAISLAGKDVKIEVALARGDAGARILTCDLTPQYVELNKA